MPDRAVRLLLADDDENDAIFFTRAFKKAGVGIPVEVVTDGVMALRRLAEPPAVTHALLDLKMPLKSGLEVLEALSRQGPRGVRAAVFSSSKVDEDVRRAYELGADFYLVKPARTSDLIPITRQVGEWVGHDVCPILSAELFLPRPK
jgi:CheY-like chemotaxis protein